MLLLGVVKEIQDYQLVLSIPNGSTATVQITHISDAYKALLQKVSEGDLTLLEKGEVCYETLLFHSQNTPVPLLQVCFQAAPIMYLWGVIL